MRHARHIALAGMILGMVLAAGNALADNGGKVRLGYVITDEDGNLSVNDETFNLYQGPTVSLEDFRYIMSNGLNLSANLMNISLNNRLMNASLFKPGCFGISLHNQQYRRIYSFEGDKFTRRRTTGGELYVYPIRQVKVYGGFDQTNRFGSEAYVIPPFGEQLLSSTDYSHTSFNVGAQATLSQGYVNAEFRRYDFVDDAMAGSDREGQSVRVTAFAPLPWYKRLALSAGYQYRQDRHDDPYVFLKSNTGWGGARLYLPWDYVAEYRFMAARTDETNRPVAIDNYLNTASISRNWPKYGGLRVGYENRITDDIYNRTSTDRYLFDAWFRYIENLMVRGRLALSNRAVTDGATLVGDEDFTRYQLSARYNIREWGDVGLSWLGRVKTDDDIDARADYNAVTAEVNLSREAYGRISFMYSYYQGNYENRTEAIPDDYEFYDHVFTGSVYPVEYYHVQVWGGATYYRSKRDNNTEKIGGYVGARYSFPRGYQLEAKYTVYNFDNFLVTDEYYTGNIINVYLIKSFVI
jgi:hypothetical protein